MGIASRWRTARTILASEFPELDRTVFVIRLGHIRNLNLGRQAQSQVLTRRRSLAGAAHFSYVWPETVREAFSWRSRADVCAGRCGTRSRRRRRSARAIAGAASANISAAEPARSARSSVRKTSPYPVR